MYHVLKNDPSQIIQKKKIFQCLAFDTSREHFTQYDLYALT